MVVRAKSALMGKAYATAGQASGCRHTTMVLQAYQADLLKDLGESEEVDCVEREICRVLGHGVSPCYQGKWPEPFGHSMAALVDIQYVVKSVWVAWQGQIIPARRSVLTSWPLWWHSTHCCWEVSGGQEAGGIVLAPVLGKVNFKSNAL